MDRNPISDLEAVAATPGLEQLAEAISRHVEPGRGSSADPMSILIFLAGRWAFGSANKCDVAGCHLTAGYVRRLSGVHLPPIAGISREKRSRPTGLASEPLYGRTRERCFSDRRRAAE
jgi:hypothetical protein